MPKRGHSPRGRRLARFGAFIAEKRKERGFKNTRAAAETMATIGYSVSSRTLSGLEQGRILDPDTDLLRAVARVYRVRFEALVVLHAEEKYGCVLSTGVLVDLLEGRILYTLVSRTEEGIKLDLRCWK